MTAWLIDMMIATTALVALVLLIRKPVARMFGSKAAYALWCAPAIRLILPPLPLMPASIATAVGGNAPSYSLIVGSSPTSNGLAVAVIVGGVWLAGAITYLALHWMRHHAFVADALANGRPLHIDGVSYDVVASSRIEGPMATGLIHPLILVPMDFEQRFSPEQQRFALLHEQLHHRRGDIWAAFAALIVASIHWFNPLMHMAVRAFRRDMEAACDASVLASTGADAAPDYAQTILRCAARPAPRSLCALTTIDELKGRLMMLKLNHGPLRRAAGIALAGALALGSVATASAAHEAAAGETQKFVKKIEIHEMRGDKDVVVKKGHGEHAMELGDCPGEKFEADAGTTQVKGKTEQVKFVLCSAKGESLLSALEKAEVDMQKDGHVPADRKDVLLAKIRAKIAELRAKG
ncbi:M56 family metallopeptidase [Sphingomonas hankyongi]|uniref:M56 family metallopeptidase n=1 Tax=Sphingomonas hankyongi TaxID=2908209 RepID=A0ABT0RZQ6_9SPHN|nr:M56 family metallopeptidase [Sphingomonas hankyongi]MCL6729074.1 M56 family metallopeptidase [Sphingomonas hankyongi]